MDAPIQEIPPSKPSAARRWALAVVALVAVLAIGLFVRGRSGAGSHASGAPSASASERVVPVPVTTVAARDLPITLEGLGTVAAFATVVVKPQVEGRIDKILFVEGQTVKAGDVLVQIDPRPFAIQLQIANAQLARDKATLANAKIALARNENLLKQGVGSQQSVDDARAEVAKDVAICAADGASISSAVLNLDFARIKSPIDGVVGVRQVDVGNVVHPSDQGGIVVLTQIDPIAVFFTLPEDDLPRVNEAMSEGKLAVEAWSRDGSKKLATGELAVVDNQINTSTATIRLKAIFKNPNRVLWPNQFVKAKLALSTKKGAIVVPATVVQRGPTGSFAYVVTGDTVAIKPVEVDMTQGDLAVIAKGLAPGDKVVVDGQNQLRPGAKIVAKPFGSADHVAGSMANPAVGAGAGGGPNTGTDFGAPPGGGVNAIPSHGVGPNHPGAPPGGDPKGAAPKGSAP